jgi:hypothetical protein
LTIWVDADSAPAKAKELCARAARRLGIEARFVSAAKVPVPAGPGSIAIVAGPGQGAADDAIMEGAKPGDLVVTRDILLAERAIAAGICAMNDRGVEFDASTIRERVSSRDASLALRLAGLAEAGPRAYGPKDAQAFANGLDRALVRLAKAPTPCQGSGIGLG